MWATFSQEEKENNKKRSSFFGTNLIPKMFENGELNRQTRAPEKLGELSIITFIISRGKRNVEIKKRQMAIDLHIHGAGPFDDVVAWASNGQTFLHQSRSAAAGRRSVADGHLLLLR
jgi:hypothetical protein